MTMKINNNRKLKTTIRDKRIQLNKIKTNKITTKKIITKQNLNLRFLNKRTNLSKKIIPRQIYNQNKKKINFLNFPYLEREKHKRIISSSNLPYRLKILLDWKRYSLIMDLHMKANGLNAWSMGRELNGGLMGPVIVGIGSLTRLPEGEFYIMPMEMFMRVNGRMINQMATVSTSIQMG